MTIFTEASAAERKRKKEEWRKAQLEKAHRDKAVTGLMRTPEGRDYLWWLFTITNVTVNPYAQSDRDTAFNCGTMNVGQRILSHLLETDPAAYAKLMMEKANVPIPDPADPDVEAGGGPAERPEPESEPGPEYT